MQIGEFYETAATCRHCGWQGKGRAMTSGDWFGDGVEKHCPACDERWGFVQWGVSTTDNPPEGWEANIGRVAD